MKTKASAERITPRSVAVRARDRRSPSDGQAADITGPRPDEEFKSDAPERRTLCLVGRSSQRRRDSRSGPAARAPRGEPPQSQRDSGPDEERSACRRQPGYRLAGEAAELACVREAHPAAHLLAAA